MSDTLKKLNRYYNESKQLRTTYETRWSRNIKLMRGIPLEDKNTASKVRGRQKIYFRKIWSTVWRLVASFYQAYLRDSNAFKVEGRDIMEDPARAAVLNEMMKYRVDRMNRKNSLFIKHVWAIINFIQYGAAFGKLSWAYNDKTGKDEPVYTVYPNEQVFPDFAADTPEDMRYVIFENYMTEDDMEEAGYENIDKAQAESVPSNQVRSSRYLGRQDPLQNPGDTEYPQAGSYEDGETDDGQIKRYRVQECFWREDDVIKFCVINGENAILKPAQDSPYGECYPLVMGQCLTEPNKLIGEGLPEPLEGPQESLNYNMNMRKDNISLALNKPTIVSRYGNVDLNALLNRTPGRHVLADDPNAVKEMDIQDVTQSSYREALVDESMMQDMSGVTPAQMGMSNSDSATESQINLSQGNAKIELYLAIGGETYFRSFYSLLAYMIQRFETDEKVFKVANAQLYRNGYDGYPVEDVDFDADVVVNAGMAFAGKEQEIRQALLILDRGAIYNQSQMQLMKLGAVPPGGFQFFNGAEIFKEIVPKIGYKDISKVIIPIQPPPPPPSPAEQLMGGMGGSGGMEGMVAPQVGDNNNMVPMNDMQSKGFGGV